MSSSILQIAFERRKTIKFIRLGQTVSNHAKAIISEKASFFMQRRSAPDDRMSALEN